MSPDVTLPTPLLLFSHLAACGLGWAMCYLITLQAGESAHPTQKGPPMRNLHVRLPVLVIVVALVVLIGIGAQSLLYMRAQGVTSDELQERDRCISAWGSRVTRALDERSAQNVDLEAAREARDRANANILLFVLNAQNDKDRNEAQVRREFNAALLEFARASAHYDEVRRQTTRVREANPYPEPPNLACGGDS